jgi:V-type H+-transporting ATPase subunit a
MVFGGRYMLILMGLFAVYAGTIYNDCFSIPLNLFGSRWSVVDGDTSDPSLSSGVYPYGVDPGWYHQSNSLAFFNSMKMKLSVTLGVTQMLFGICIGALNNLYFRNSLAFYFEFIPRITFMLCTFGYMVFLIVYKFCIDWHATDSAPPNLVQTMIAMFLSPGHVEADKQLYSGQALVQGVLLLLALGSVPVMLLVQPLIARAQHAAIFGSGSPRQSSAYRTVSERVDHDLESGGAHGSDPSEVLKEDAPTETAHVEDSGHGADPTSAHYSYSDHAITQGIHTIEFVLGAVSNTASYLRLWALSLAHAELSEVFWSKMIMTGIEGTSPILYVADMHATEYRRGAHLEACALTCAE